MSKHTRGPWAIKGTLFGEWHISSEFGVEGNRLINGRQHIASSPSASSKLNPDYFAMFMANARLIAAAPDLLDDLAEAAATLRRYEALHRAKNTDESTAKAEVNAALATRFEATIAKARGEA